MKLFITSVVILSALTACNFKEGLKETGDAIQDGTQDAVEAAKKLPADISEASNKAEADIKK